MVSVGWASFFNQNKTRRIILCDNIFLLFISFDIDIEGPQQRLVVLATSRLKRGMQIVLEYAECTPF